MKNLKFNALRVSCYKDLGGDILQVYFESIIDNSPDDIETVYPSFTIIQNFEFPGPPYTEWSDDNDYDGGKDIKRIELKRNSILVIFRDNFTIEIFFKIDEKEFQNLETFLGNIARKYIPLIIKKKTCNLQVHLTSLIARQVT